MDPFLPLLRVLAGLVSPLWAWLKKPRAERAVARGTLTEYSPIQSLDQDTLAHLGAGNTGLNRWESALHSVLGQLIRSEELSRPHAVEWLQNPDTVELALSVAHARIAGAPEATEDFAALVTSYSIASGEHQKLAASAVEKLVNVLVAGQLGAVKDDGLSAQIRISFIALHKRLDELHGSSSVRLRSLDEALKANENWLASAFANRRKAKVRLGQPLCPADPDASASTVLRNDLSENFESLLSALPISGVLAITGDEGNGKSWLFAQSWLRMNVKPLTLFITADDVEGDASTVRELLLQKLVVQSQGLGFEFDESFWKSQLNAWRSQGTYPAAGILVVLDGLNQRPRKQWALLIDRLSEEIEGLNGKIIVTCRRGFFEREVRPSLASPLRQLYVPEWSVSERDQQLSAHGVESVRLHPQVASTLCNPRLLGIALTLLDSDRLQEMEELSIPLLLFEHLRATHTDSYGEPAHAFVRKLRDHAAEILHRLNGAGSGDLTVFDGGLEPVAEGRFFVPMAGDPSRYTIRREGLGLALGLAVLDDLRAAVRNGNDLDETLATITEPIATLDQTSEAMLAALTVACITAEEPDEIGKSILSGIAGLQNLDDSAFDAIVLLARTRPKIFLDTAAELALHGGSATNFDVIEHALFLARENSGAWEEISRSVQTWLTHITFDVENRIPWGGTTEETSARRVELRGRLETNLKGLAHNEHTLLSALFQTDAKDVSSLGRMALRFLAKKPLAPFAQGLVLWSFSASLNGGYSKPLKEFQQLVRFNSIDWSLTRDEFLRLSAPLRSPETSRTGRWTLVTVLGATGAPEDAREAQQLVDELRAGQPKFENWRLVENYCSVDPCNPSNEAPSNVAITAEAYGKIDVAQLFLHMGVGSSDQFFIDARPAVARFHPDIAVERHRALAENVLTRIGLPLRQGIFA